MTTETPKPSAPGDVYDHWFRTLHGAQNVTGTKLSVKQIAHPVTEATTAMTVQTMRHDPNGDYVFLTFQDCRGSLRIVLPPEVATLIARQRDSLTGMNRSKAARDAAQKRKAAGIAPAFLKGKKKGGKKS
jgi:hypothetical protein